MKVYTHPAIDRPCGSVVVKFYDDTKSGAETTPKIIVGIGDMEEGFDFDVGDVILASLTLKMHNKSNYLIGTLLTAEEIRVAVFINNELHFYGFANSPVNTSGDPSEDFSYSEFDVKFIHHFAKLKDVRADIFETEVYNTAISTLYFTELATSRRYLFMKAIWAYFCFYLDLKLTAVTDINFICQRNYYDAALYPTGPVTYPDICTYDQNLNQPFPENGFSKRFKSAFEIFQELCTEFHLFAFITHDGSDFILNVRERDGSRLISTPAIKNKSVTFRDRITACFTDLDGRPEDLLSAYFYAGDQYFLDWGDKINLKMHHTNIFLEHVDADTQKISNGFDWTDSDSNGVADDWTLQQGSASITTSAGFTGNVKKVIVHGTTFGGGIYQDCGLVADRVYKLTFKHQTVNVSTNWRVRENNLGKRIIKTLTRNTGGAVSETIYFTMKDDGGILFEIEEGSNSGSYFLLDEVSIEECWIPSVIWGIENPIKDNTYTDIGYILNYDDAVEYESFQIAMARHFMALYYDKAHWLRVDVVGVRGTYSAANKLEHLAPGYNIAIGSIIYHIHAVTKSVERNQSNLLCLPIGVMAEEE